MGNNTMKIDAKILEELSRFNSINKYINEQELPRPPAEDPLAGAPADPLAGAPADPLAGGTPPAPEAAGTTPPPAPETGTPVDVAADPDVEKVGEEDGEDKTNLEITDLVKSQKKIEEKQDDYFEQLFGHLETLESKLGEMDEIVNKLNSLEAKVEKYREKTPQEKLELKTLDSGPFNQKLSDFFIDKQ
jgi:hypothetical protein